MNVIAQSAEGQETQAETRPGGENAHLNGNGQLKTIAGLNPNHYEKLRSSGLTDETIRANGLRSINNAREIAEILNRSNWPRKNGSILAIPYTGEGGDTLLIRGRPDNPPLRGGKTQKYVQPSGVPVRVYFPAGVRKRIENRDQPIIFTEGEFKAAKATQEGFPALSIPGVSCWHKKRGTALSDDLAHIDWNRRLVYIGFDSDAVTKTQVKDEEILLAAALTRLGAIVRIIRFPAGPDGEKVGLDDFLVAHGASAFNDLLKAAEEPERPTGDEGKADASDLDPAPEAASIIAAETTLGFSKIRRHREEFLVHRGSCYEDCSDEEVRSKVICWLNRRYTYVTPKATNAVVDQLRAQSHLSDRVKGPAWLKRQEGDWPVEELLCVKNGILHLPTAANGAADCLLPHTARLFNRNALPYSFDPAASRPTAWLNFLDQVWGDDPQSIETLQQWFGLCLVPDTSQQKILLIVGPKRSGKGTIGRVLRAMIGETNVAAPTLGSLAGPFGLQPLIDKLLAVVADARLSGRADTSTVVERLLSISGEDPQDVARKYLTTLTLKLPTRFMLLTNEIPKLSDTTGAMASRFIPLEMTRSFYGHEDHTLIDKLLLELPSILNWSIAGWQLLRERGHLTQPLSASRRHQELEDLGSPIKAFIRERAILGANCKVTTKAFFDDWLRWCRARAHKDLDNELAFGHALAAAEPHIERKQFRIDGLRPWHYVGIGLMDQKAREIE